MYIDIHTHAFHPKIAHKVVAQLEDHYNIKPVGNGLAEDLKERLTRAGLLVSDAIWPHFLRT